MGSSSILLNRRRRRVGSSLGVGLSLIAHLVFLAALAFGVKRSFDATSVPIADIELIPAVPSVARRNRQTKPLTPGREPREVAPSTQQKQVVEAPAVTSAPIQPALPPTSVLPPANEAAPPALRLGVGCAHAEFMQLTAEERAACRDRLASRGAGDRDYAAAGIDPKVRAAFDARRKAETFLRSPFLSAMPKKGCRPRVTEHDAAAFGKSQPDVTFQATCVVNF